jgi:hypothetical protein
MTGENPLERAFHLARSGECQDMNELEQRLKREGFVSVQNHLSGPSIRRQLRDMMARIPQPTED